MLLHCLEYALTSGAQGSGSGLCEVKLGVDVF